ncbi:M20 aminoacylase family protein [Mesorhizobium sp. ES1-1]|uniref:M20 aminoacylase family protein n=1 Tax=Mesorhizobium sp. ES1-1 TaxID=2876629 RepID=UPI001CCC2E1A|nr:M20 aminoacylase family protein [Mesorhizobium sp. ES1-1]MBZ9678542.1 M20 family metallopeptidase [Mesorhizobium sp. ES1-1]
MGTDFAKWLNDNVAWLTELRRDLHAHPELGFEEERTSRIVADMLRQAGIEVTQNVGRTGVIGVIKGRLPGQRSIGLRADMDALPILEATGLPYASKSSGCMHACGHDGHTTMLLGAALYLAENRDFGGTLNLIFQPAEEGRGGADAMLADGIFERFPCDAIYGLHNQPGAPVGTMAGRLGPSMAAADFWQVIFKGVGGHGGVAPHQATDITYAQAQFVLSLQGIVGRSLAPLETGVISVGYIHGGSAVAPSVIPSELVIGGTTRSFRPETRDLIERRMREVADQTARTWGCQAEFKFNRSTSVVVSAEEPFKSASAAARATVGEQNYNDRLDLSCAGEDFANMMDVRPGAFLWIGNGIEPDGTFHQLHTPHYNFNDDIIPTGVRYWINLTHLELGGDCV